VVLRVGGEFLTKGFRKRLDRVGFATEVRLGGGVSLGLSATDGRRSESNVVWPLTRARQARLWCGGSMRGRCAQAQGVCFMADTTIGSCGVGARRATRSLSEAECVTV